MEMITNVSEKPVNFVTVANNDTASIAILPNSGLDAKDIASKLWIYIGPFLFFIALLGNSISFLVMRRPSFRHQSTGVFLQCLAVADVSFVVVGLLPEWLEITQIVHIKALHQSICKIYKFMFYVTGDVAIYILVAFTCHRCYSVCRPFQERGSDTFKKIKWIILVIIMVSFIKSIPQFWARGVEYKQGKDGVWTLKTRCGYPSEAARHYVWYVRPYIVLFVVFALPLLVITVCNVLIVHSLRTSAQFTLASSTSTKEAHGHRQTTIMCLTVSCLFLVTMTPSFVMLAGKPAWFGLDGYVIAKAVSNLLVYVNHSCNFLMYCLCARRFRQELVAMVRGVQSSRKKGSDNNSSTPMPEISTTPQLDRLQVKAPSRPEGMTEHSQSQMENGNTLALPARN